MHGMIATLLSTLLLHTIPVAGAVAPDFTATDSDGNVHHLAEMVEQKTVIVAFFPKAFTGGCTQELKAYRDRYTEVEKAEGTVLAVSMDKRDTLKKFKESLKASFAFIPDPEGKLVSLYDVKMPVVSFAKRYTFVIGPGRKILRVDQDDDAIHVENAVRACPLRKPKAG